MNAQGEAWTAERVLNYLCDGIDLKVVGEAAFMHQALKQALAIVRLHPELVAALEKLSAYKGYSNIRDLLARAHALSCEKRENPTTD